MKEEKNTANRVFYIILIVLGVLYLALFIANNTGYYSFNNKKNLTEEQIKKFEEDVKNGVEVDLNDYLSDTNISYQNNISKLGYNISSFIESLVRTSVFKIFDFFSDLIETD